MINNNVFLFQLCRDSGTAAVNFRMAHFMDKLAASFGWGPNPLKVSQELFMYIVHIVY